MNQAETIQTDVYSIVTNRFIDLLENGTLPPWRQPWTGAGIPMNAISKNQYRGINHILLSSLGYEHNLYLTFKQVQEINASVKRGAVGHLVCFWKKKEQEQAELHAETEEPKKYRSILRYYKVFNISDIEKLPAFLERQLAEHDHTPSIQHEAIVKGMPNPPAIVHKKAEAFYDPSIDAVNMPKPGKFSSPDLYYSTLFHELIHSTGHSSRINRPEVAEISKMTKESYSLEELTAEIGASFLNALCGINNELVENSAAYIAGWLKVLKNDKRFIFQAAGRAQHAVDYITAVAKQTED